MTEQRLSQQTKNYISHLKVASFRHGFYDTEKGKRSAAGFSLHVFEKENGVIFCCRSRQGGNFGDYFKYKLRIFKIKSGETRFRFYDITQAIGRPVARTCSPCLMQSKLRRIISSVEGGKTKGENRRAVKDGLYLAQQRRLLAFLRSFLLRHQVNVGCYSKNPLNMLTQLCYPGTKNFSDDVISSNVSCGAFFLDDPVKLALRSRGKLGKKLAYQAIADFPQGAQSLLRFTKYIRISRSLDHAQRFLSSYSEEIKRSTDYSRIALQDSFYSNVSVSLLSARTLKLFDRFSEEELFRAFVTERRLFWDSLLMIQRLNANNGFGLDVSQIRTIDQLHNALIEAAPNKRRSKKFTHYKFNDSLNSIKFSSLLASNLKSSSYIIEYAQNTEELDMQARKMHNCAFGYHAAVNSGNYAIFCVRVNDSPKFMFGVRLFKDYVQLDQAVAHCNQRMEPAVFNALNEEIKQAVIGEYKYNFIPMQIPEKTGA